MLVRGNRTGRWRALGRGWRIGAAIVIGAFVFISGMSIGLLYLPAGILMLLAACVGGHREAAACLVRASGEWNANCLLDSIRTLFG